MAHEIIEMHVRIGYSLLKCHCHLLCLHVFKLQKL